MKSLSENAAYSLLECSLVLALIACIVGIGVFHTGFLYRTQLQAEADALYATMRYLQQRAITMHTEQHLKFDLTKHRYHFNGTEYALPSAVRFGCIAGALGPPSAPTKPITRICSFADSTITFWPDGIIKPGTIYLIDKAAQHAYALSSPVGAVSYLRIYCYKDNVWLCRS